LLIPSTTTSVLLLVCLPPLTRLSVEVRTERMRRKRQTWMDGWMDGSDGWEKKGEVFIRVA
jgi:hypothetical protein